MNNNWATVLGMLLAATIGYFGGRSIKREEINAQIGKENHTRIVNKLEELALMLSKYRFEAINLFKAVTTLKLDLGGDSDLEDETAKLWSTVGSILEHSGVVFNIALLADIYLPEASGETERFRELAKKLTSSAMKSLKKQKQIEINDDLKRTSEMALTLYLRTVHKIQELLEISTLDRNADLTHSNGETSKRTEL